MTPRRTSSQPDESPGSPSSGEPVFLAVGKLGRPHGVRGEIAMEILTDFPERLKPGLFLFIGPEYRPMKLRTRRPFKQGVMLVSFEGIEDRDAAGQLRNQLVSVPASDRPALPEGEYYHHQLLGLRVVDEAGNQLGVLDYIMQTGANDVYVVRTDAGKELLLPGIDSVIQSVDLPAGEIRVRLLPGLIQGGEEENRS